MTGVDAIALPLVAPLRPRSARSLEPAQASAFALLANACAAALPGCVLRLNHNRRTILSLRGHAGGRWSLSVHVRLLEDATALAEIPAWAATRGRRTSALLRQALRTAWLVAQSTAPIRAAGEADGAALADLAVLGGRLDLQAEFARLYASWAEWFAALPRPTIRWSRHAHRPLSHIRFGSYRRDRALICLHPRLDQPWVARVFVEHVIFHELCHHAQACAPLRREPPHSPRFRAWERRYPHHTAALAWERLHLARLLDG